ncbi:hypothetical protein FD975_10100 [Polynucleobacter sp. AP-Jannik-300A-C4]|uniref:hypothetical protein n=1 Tax=Polynucleobacter sp. AP-Jannik-300A-C4 TaxID=2576928 RepID=UPI001BFEC0EF|nr:hypothetical protein [Polynucleobacter sp. AP-Jannik-300A-C4]QWE22593.1 hypothetical protein FD975_10100 [Polynucleobacter sp. AP-Jannik-300A-C4]
MAKKDLSEFGWGTVIDNESITSVTKLVAFKGDDEKPWHCFFADIGGVEREFMAPNVKVGWFNDGQPYPGLIRLRAYLISCMK